MLDIAARQCSLPRLDSTCIKEFDSINRSTLKYIQESVLLDFNKDVNGLDKNLSVP